MIFQYSELEPQSKNWVLELKLEMSVLPELSQSRGPDSAFRKGLYMFENSTEKS